MPKDQEPKTVPAHAAPGDGKSTAPRSIVVKFKDNITLPYVDELEKYFPNAKIAGWDAVKNIAPGCTVRRVLRAFAPNNTQALFDLAAKRNPKLKAKREGLFHHFVLDGVPTPVLEHVLEQLRGWPEVEYAYLAPKVLPPPANGIPTIPREQHYFKKPAPFGIDLEYALQLPGGDGTGQQVVDVEMGWDLNHTGLRNAAGASSVKQIGTLNDPAYAQHGTNVLGILCGTNQSGVLGAASRLSAGYVVGHNDYDGASIPAAIELAILSLMPGVVPARLGDPGYLTQLVNGPVLPQVPGGPVILLEVQVADPENGLPMPAEIDPVVGDLIEIATAIGIVVVEAAANGSQDLDQYPDKYRGTTDKILNPNVPGEFRDTGAIMVGSGNRPPRLNNASTPWERDAASNFGHRLDCFGWGNSVFTLDTTNPTRNDFSGTSSAAAIVAGAALALQGLALAHRNKQCSPLEARKFLGDRTTGPLQNTPSENPGSDLIGVMPNLRHIAINGLGIPPVAAPPPPV